MWTYIEKANIENYVKQHSSLKDIFNDIVLLETADAVFLPRLMYSSYPSEYLKIHEGTKNVEPGTVDFKFSGELRPNQTPIINSLLDTYKQGHVNGIVKARPGIGKTVMSVYLASKIGLKTCIIVDNTSLMEQWIKAFYDFTDLSENDIGIVKQKMQILDKPVTICMVQSLLSKMKNDMKAAFEFIDSGQFGTVFYDEVHSTSSSMKYSKVSLLFRTKNIIGLSATPFQDGAAEVLMHNTIGELLYETKEYELKPKYYFIHYDSGLGEKHSKKLLNIRDYIRRRAFYNKVIVESETYISLITKYTQNLLKNKHRIIIICFTKNQVMAISNNLTSNGIENRRYYGSEREIDKETDRVLVVTYSFCGKGFDFKQLSALIYASPFAGKKSIIQTCGRILRDSEDKVEPIVLDLIDNAFPFMSLKDIPNKTKIVKDEFDIPILEYRER